MVKDIFPGSAPVYSYNAYITRAINYVYFQADDGVNGSELWRSDGTAAGTVMIKDIYPGNKNSLPINLYNYNDTLFFTADNGVNGYELWTCAGTAQKTALAKDIFPGAGSSSPNNFTKSGTTLFFTAGDDVAGRELWKFNTAPALQNTVAITNVSCNGLSNAAINITPSGGTQPYTFSWSNSATTEDISGLAAGTFTVGITDALGWTLANTFTVTQPAALNATLASQTNVACNNGNNGAINLNVGGGTTPYIFLWSNNAATQNISGLTANNYSVLVSDANNCTKTFAATITQPLAVSAFTNVIDASCNGGNNGYANVNVVMGVSPYSFLWSPNANSQTTQTAVGLSASTYTVKVTDANGCTGTFTATIIQPTAFSTTISVTNVKCSGGSNGIADLSVTGSNPPYNYSWSNSAITQDITNVSAATYTVTITDSKGCTKTNTAIINQPSLLNPNFTHANVTCSGLCNGLASVGPTGGTSPYIYSWQTTPVQTAQTATGLCPGNYNITITDNNGCVNVPSITIIQPAVLTVSISITNATCNHANGSATASPSGGTTPYLYLWSNANTNQTATGLATGNYSVTITDAKGCTTSASLVVNISAPPQQICIVTVDSTSTKNLLIWEKTPNLPISSFRIYREIASAFTQIGSVSYTSLSEFMDNTNGVNPKFASYKYKLSAIDSCGNESYQGAFHQTIHLQVSPASPWGYNLKWNDYIGFPVTQYRIMRDTIAKGVYHPVDSLSPGPDTWTDTKHYRITDTVGYYIEVNYPGGSCVSSIKGPQLMGSNLNLSKSNINRIADTTVTAVIGVNDNYVVSIYPNPNRGLFTLELNTQSGRGEVKVFNLLGEEIKRLQVTDKYEKLKIDLSGYAKGVYHVQVKSGNSIINKKIIIE